MQKIRTFFGSQNIARILLSWVAGFVDAASFFGLKGLFTSHITGNLVIAATEIIGLGNQTLWVRIAVIPVFMFAVALTTILSRRYAIGLKKLLQLETIFLLIFTTTAIVIKPENQQSVNNIPLFLTGSLGVFSMGIQNTLIKESLDYIAPTTAMTNNLTQFTIDLTLLRELKNNNQPPAPSQEIDASRARLAKFGSSLLGFSLGAILGGILTSKFGLFSLCLPSLLMAFLSFNTTNTVFIFGRHR